METVAVFAINRCKGCLQKVAFVKVAKLIPVSHYLAMTPSSHFSQLLLFLFILYNKILFHNKVEWS